MTITRTQQGEPSPDGEMPDNLGLVDDVIKIGQERAKILLAMKAALLRGDDDEALERARELTGLPTKRPTNSRS